MSESNPKISVILSAYNSQATLEASLNSILQQTYKDFEFIIIDDGSTDRSRTIIEEFARQDQRIIPIYNEENIGLTRSLNNGLAIARGEFIARADADDISFPTRFEKQIAFFEIHPEIGILSANFQVIDDEGNLGTKSNYPRTDLAIRWHLLFNCPFCHPCVMFRTALSINDQYDVTVPYSQDYEYWSRLMQFTRGANLDEVLLYYRRGKVNVSTKNKTEQSEIATTIAYRNLNSLFGYDYFSKQEARKLQAYHRYETMPVDHQDRVLFRKWLKTYQVFKSKHDDISNKNELIQIRKTLAKRITNLYLRNFSKIGLSSTLIFQLMIFSPFETIGTGMRFIVKSFLGRV